MHCEMEEETALKNKIYEVKCKPSRFDKINRIQTKPKVKVRKPKEVSLVEDDPDLEGLVANECITI